MAKIQIKQEYIHQERTERQLNDAYIKHLNYLEEVGELVNRNQKWTDYINGQYSSTKEAFQDIFGKREHCAKIADIIIKLLKIIFFTANNIKKPGKKKYSLKLKNISWRSWSMKPEKP